MAAGAASGVGSVAYVATVSDPAPEAVARNLLRDGSKPFFSYERFAVDSEGQDVLALVPDSLIPIIHTAKIHLSPADTGRSALADSIRAVLVSLQATNGLTGAAERRGTVRWLIPPPHAGPGKMGTGGPPPIPGGSLPAPGDPPPAPPATRPGAAPGTTTTAAPSPAPSTTSTTVAVLGPGSSGPAVLALQQRLSSLGYWLGTPDGTAAFAAPGRRVVPRR